MLIHQQSYMYYNLLKPANKKIRDFVYAATTSNNTLAKLLPLFNVSQKLPPVEFLYAVHQNIEKKYCDIIKFQGFKLANGIVKGYIKMYKRANPDENSKDNSLDGKKKQAI